MRSLCLVALFTLGLSFPASAAPPPGEATKTKGRERVRSITTVLNSGDAEDKVFKKPFKVVPLHMTKGSAYLLHVKSTAFDPVLRVVTGGEDEVARNDNAAGTKDARIDFIAPKDDEFHMLVSTADGQFGGFTLTITPMGRPGDAGITLFEGKLKADAKAEHTIKTAKDRKYVVDLLFLADVKTGKLSGENLKKAFREEKAVAEPGRRRAQLEYLSEGEGELKLAVNGEGEASYLLRIRDVRAPGGVFVIGKEDMRVEDELTDEDPNDTKRTSCHCKVFRVKLQAGMTYEINMTAGYDTYLRLENPEGKEVAQDDDGGEGLNSRIRFACKAEGVYSVIATSFVTATGAFKLSVSEAKEKEKKKEKAK